MTTAPDDPAADDWFDDDEDVTAGDTAVVRVDVAGLARGSTRLFAFRRQGEDLDGIVMRRPDGGLSVFVNRCPHALFTLDVGDGNVTSDDGRQLVCWMHGAIFDAETGRGTNGVVRGRGLEPLPFQRDGDTVTVTITPEPEGWPRC